MNSLASQFAKPCRRSGLAAPREAFSLIELLTVMGIMSLLLVATLPSLSRLSSASFSNSLVQISSTLDYARAEAMSRNTYVWVGLKNIVTNGTSTVRISMVRSQDGGTNLSSSNLCSAGKSLSLENVMLVGIGDLNSDLRRKISDDTGAGTMVDMSNPGTSQTFTEPPSANQQTYTSFILFTPQGEALVPQNSSTSSATPFVPYILIALRPTKGTVLPADDANGAAIILSGGNSHQRSYRL